MVAIFYKKYTNLLVTILAQMQIFTMAIFLFVSIHGQHLHALEFLFDCLATSMELQA
jgi:hypothetical protein